MQFLATGGLVLFVPYIMLIAFITYRGFRLLIKSKESEKLKIGAIFGVWLGTISVNLVTVDNLGVAVWFWITGGVLLGLTSEDDIYSIDTNLVSKTKIQKRRSDITNHNSFPFSQSLAGILALMTLVMLVPLIDNSSNLKLVKGGESGNSSSIDILRIKELADESWNDHQNLLQLSVLAFKAQDLEAGNDILNRVYELDNRSFYANYFRAFTLEAVGKRSEAIPYRERLVELDPWNNASLIELIKNYQAVGDRASAQKIASIIKQNYPGSQSDIDASALLVE
jgi:hypothetical protein